MSRKQKLYLEIFNRILPFMRNIQTHSAWRRLRYGSFYPETELVHNLPRLLLFPDFTEYDIHWLDCQARIFFERGNNPLHGYHEPITSCISELFDLVPENLKPRLTWTGPPKSKLQS